MPLAVAALVTTGGPAAIDKVRACEPVPAELVALIVALKEPEAVGVPEMRPVEVFTLRPAGRPVAPKFVGRFAAVIW